MASEESLEKKVGKRSEKDRSKQDKLFEKAVESAIPIEDMLPRLRNIEQHLPNQTPLVYNFANYLAQILSKNDELEKVIPQIFLAEAESLLAYLECEITTYHGQRIPPSLTGHNPAAYASLRTRIPEIAEAAASSKDFADCVRECYDSINEIMREKRH